MALLHGNPVILNTPAPGFMLKGVDGRRYSLQDFSGKKILVVIFMCNHCPYAKAVIARFVKLQEDYRDKDVQLIGINPNDTETYPEDSFENMIAFADERKINFPYLADETQDTARAYDAVCTPDIYVYDEKRLLKYRGRLDDNWQDESRVTANDLRKAIDILLGGEEIDFPQTPSMGCSIKWK